MPRNAFHNDLSRGVVIENIALQNIKNKYPNAYKIEGYCKEYDIWIPEIKGGIEVKYDSMSNQTGNVVIEIEMFGKPSALITTKADWWIFYDDNVFVAIKPIDIINCIFQNKLTYVSFVGNGDTNKKKAFLIKKGLLFKYGVELRDWQGYPSSNTFKSRDGLCDKPRGYVFIP